MSARRSNQLPTRWRTPPFGSSGRRVSNVWSATSWKNIPNVGRWPAEVGTRIAPAFSSFPTTTSASGRIIDDAARPIAMSRPNGLRETPISGTGTGSTPAGPGGAGRPSDG